MRNLRRKKEAKEIIEEQSQEEVQLSDLFMQQSKLLQGLDHGPKFTHLQLLEDPRTRGAYSLGDRCGQWISRLICCLPSETTFVDQIDQAQRALGADLGDAAYKSSLQGKILNIRVLGTSRLELDPNIAHPFVRVHLVDKRTGAYVMKQKPDTPAIYHHEQIAKWQDDQKSFKAFENDLILPMATTCCDFRLEGNAFCSWRGDGFLINQSASYLLNPDLLILFQLLDFNHKLLVQRSHGLLNRDLLYPIAWGYLRPVGLARRHFGLTKIQLFRYKCNSKALPQDFPPRVVPSVYLQFIWQRKEKYPGFLSVVVQHIAKPQPKLKYVDPPLHVLESEAGNKGFFEGLIRKSKDSRADAEAPPAEVDKSLERMIRLQSQDSHIPTTLRAKYFSGKLGCLRIKFSHQGKTLACACSSPSAITTLKFYDISRNKLVFEFSGHSGYIYSIAFSEDDRLLLSASADTLVKLWNVPPFTDQFIDQAESEALIAGIFPHPSFVYAASFVQRSKAGVLIATVCADCKVRVWSCSLSGQRSNSVQCLTQLALYDRPARTLFGNCCTFSNGMLYVGDTMGVLHFIDFENSGESGRICERVGRMTHQQLEGDPINEILVTKEGGLIVSSRNNVIRMCELASGKLQVTRRYFGSTSERQSVLSSLSPDEAYLLSGSQDGRPYLWDLKSGAKLDTGMDIELEGVVTACEWNPKYHCCAVSAFGAEYPVYLFAHERSEEEEKAALGRMRSKG